MMSAEHILFVSSVLLLISLLAANRAFRYGIPTLLLFLAVGMLAGSEGIGGIYFDSPVLAQFIGVVSLNFILFSGGLDTRWKAIQPVMWQGVVLSTAGVFVTAFSLGLFIYWLTNLSLIESLLLGSIVSSTDAAAVFSILRGKNLRLRGRLRPLLELESGSNDPMAYVLTISFLSLLVNQDQSAGRQVLLFLQQMALGALAGYLSGRYGRLLINKMQLGFEGLYPALTVALMLLVFSLTSIAGGNGFLAIYITAVMLANAELIHKNTIIKVFDGLAWIMQIVLFLTLGLLVFPSHIVPVLGIGILIALFQIIVSRPIGVFLSLLPFRMPLREIGFTSWVGLRGAVPIVFATYPLIAGIDKSDLIFNIVFAISVVSVLLQGTTIPFAARLFGVTENEAQSGPQNLSDIFDEETKTCMKEFVIPTGSTASGKKLLELNFPENALIAMIKRDGTYLIPGGNTTVKEGDIVVVIATNQEGLEQATASLSL
ncbi:MAG: potassium/proton antiporter [Bacteroidia bacterium]|jgi:cell volume regulation protein A|nr:potassium/proton antiporter [Bacteroidia bacterium]